VSVPGDKCEQFHRLADASLHLEDNLGYHQRFPLK
jgi:hypothetical protein